MIKQILKIAQSCSSLNIMAVAMADGGLSLTFIPKLKEGGDPALAQPIMLKGTPEELEAGLADALDQIQAKRTTLADTVEAATAVLAQATKDAADKATKNPKVNTKAKPVKSASASDDTDSGENDSEDGDDGPGDTGTVASSTPAADLAAASTSQPDGGAELNLFGS